MVFALLLFLCLLTTGVAQDTAVQIQALQPEVQTAAWAVKWWMPRHEEKLKKLGEMKTVDLLMIGDSITWQVTDHLRSAIPGIRGAGPDGSSPIGDEEFGVIGRTFSKAPSALARIMAGGAPDVLIVALGTNPPMTLSQVDAFMAQTGGIARVIFVNIRIPRDWEASTNALINSLPQRFNNVTVVDWYGYSGSRPHLLNSSGYHLSDAGKPEYAALVAAEAAA